MDEDESQDSRSIRDDESIGVPQSMHDIDDLLK